MNRNIICYHHKSYVYLLQISFLSISKTVIGLTIIAFGTSLPEIAAAVASLFNRRVDIALGSIIGSNIFNIAAGLGITRLVSELEVPNDMLLIGIPILF